MSRIVACPSCARKLRVTDELRGQLVRCPACNQTFDSAHDPEPPPAPANESSAVPQDLPLELTLDEPSSEPKPAAPSGTPGLVGAVELKLSLDDESPPAPASPPAEPSPPHESWQPPRRKPPRLVHEHDEDAPPIRRRGPRRDSEPHRGALVLTLGIVSLACLVISCFPVGVILGLAAWIMGQKDLRKMRRDDMDPEGQGITQAGWICGILGTALNGLVTLGCGAFFAIIFIAENNRTYPTTKPAIAPPVQKWQPPPNPPQPRFPR